MRDFEVLFDYGEEGELPEPLKARYGRLGFPDAEVGRPWVYANFVQTMDGIVSLLGDESGGADIAQAPEDRWLMDLLRAHADAVMLGMGTLREEQRLGRPRARGPVFRIVDAELRQLRAKLGRGRERNVLLTARADFQMSDYAVFDGEQVDVTVVTTREGARRLEEQRPRLSPNDGARTGGTQPESQPGSEQGLQTSSEATAYSWVDIIAVEGTDEGVDLRQALAALKERYGIRYLLCEGGPSLYSGMLTAGLIDEQFVTVSPIEVGRRSAQGPRPSVLPEVGFSRRDAARWRWLSCRKVGDAQFHRFRRKLKVWW